MAQMRISVIAILATFIFSLPPIVLKASAQQDGFMMLTARNLVSGSTCYQNPDYHDQEFSLPMRPALTILESGSTFEANDKIKEAEVELAQKYCQAFQREISENVTEQCKSHIVYSKKLVPGSRTDYSVTVSRFGCFVERICETKVDEVDYWAYFGSLGSDRPERQRRPEGPLFPEECDGMLE